MAFAFWLVTSVWRVFVSRFRFPASRNQSLRPAVLTDAISSGHSGNGQQETSCCRLPLADDA